MRFALLTASTVLVGGLIGGTANAAPAIDPSLATHVAHVTPAVATGTEADVIFVRGGCGWGAHRSYSGRCHYNHGWRGRARYYYRHRW